MCSIQELKFILSIHTKLKQQYEVYIYMHRVMIGGQIHLVTGYKMHIQFHPKVTWTYTIGHFKSQLFN